MMKDESVEMCVNQQTTTILSNCAIWNVSQPFFDILTGEHVQAQAVDQKGIYCARGNKNVNCSLDFGL